MQPAKPSSDPFDGGDRAAALGNAPYRLRDRFDHHRHVEGVGVHQRSGVAQNRDMPLPEHQVAATQSGQAAGRQRLARARFCMSLSRGQAIPLAVRAICTSPEQSSPRLVSPPQR